MISALRKIEGRGELPGATSAVMEMCIDNPREGFSDIFATHPSVDRRAEALVKFAGGRDPGPLNPPSDAEEEPGADQSQIGRREGEGTAPDAAPKQVGPWNMPLPTGATAGPWGARQG
jgi:heat shock protein HtpX